MGDKPGADEGKRHHDSERVHGEAADVKQLRVHPAPSVDTYLIGSRNLRSDYRMQVGPPTLSPSDDGLSRPR
jgi:hypothetical protein